MASCGLGCAISFNITRPVDLYAHLFSQSSFSLFFSICLMVFCVQGGIFCGFVAPILASLSTVSFPLMLQCPGIHWSVT